MKLKITSLVAIGLGAFASFAGAQTPVIDITGSTAGRSAVHASILNVLDGETYAFAGSATAAKATSAIYKGKLGGSTGPNVIIRTYWSGSVNGVRDVGEQLAQTKLLATSEALNPTSVAGTYTTSPSYAASSETDSKPEIGFSDVFASSTGYTVPVETSVAVIPFKWFKSADASANLTNMTPGLFQALYGSLGELSLALFTGNSADEGSIVYALGRNSDSGTRITTLAEAGFGVFNGVSQYTATYGSGNMTLSATTGNTGFSSGSDMKGALLCNCSSGSVVGYVGASDWLGVPTQELTWNGVAYSTDNLFNGKYTFWGYLHMNSITLSGTSSTFFTSLSTDIKNSTTSGIEKITSMRVERQGDGAPVTPLY